MPISRDGRLEPGDIVIAAGLPGRWSVREPMYTIQSVLSITIEPTCYLSAEYAKSAGANALVVAVWRCRLAILDDFAGDVAKGRRRRM